MRKEIWVLSKPLNLAALSFVISALVAIPAIAEDAGGSGSGNGSASATAQTSNPSNPTSAAGVGGGSSVTNASNNGTDQANADSGSTSSANASASAGNANVGLGIGTNSSANASLNGTDSNANSKASASGNVGSANLAANVQAQATSTPGQLTASAAASDGSYAYAALGAINSLVTFVPSGVTKTLQNGQGTLSISCNSGGTCSQASVGSNSVYAGIRMVTTSAGSAGGVESVLRAVLNAEASAGWHEIYSSAEASISGFGNGHGADFAAGVSGNSNARSQAWVGHPPVAGSGWFWNVSTTEGAKASGWVWSRGNQMCASTYVKSKAGLHKMKKVSVCKRIAKQKTTAQRSIFESWFGAKGKKS